MNSNTIDRPEYYDLPCGRQLEDFIWERGLSFFTGSALKYRWRAGRKDGESREKDLAKANHFAREIAMRKRVALASVQAYVLSLVHDAEVWDGGAGGVSHRARVRTWRPGEGDN